MKKILVFKSSRHPKVNPATCCTAAAAVTVVIETLEKHYFSYKFFPHNSYRLQATPYWGEEAYLSVWVATGYKRAEGVYLVQSR